MSEFVDRMNVQRSVLRAVNAQQWTEDLFGLSSKAIDRWLVVNQISSESTLAALLRETSNRLRFLANRSQEQVSPEYSAVCRGVQQLIDAISGELRSKH